MINVPETDVVGALSDGAHMGGGLNGQDAYTGRILAQVTQGVDVYNGQVTGEVAASVTAASGISNATGPKVMEGTDVAIPLDTMTIQGRPSDKEGRQGKGYGSDGDPSFTLSKGHSHAVCHEGEAKAFGIQSKVIGRKDKNSPNGSGINEELSFTLDSTDKHAVCHEGEPIPLDMRQCSRSPDKKDEINRQSTGVGEHGDPSYPVTSAFVHGVAHEGEGGAQKPAVCSWNGDITPKSAEDVSVTLRAQQGGEGTGVAFTSKNFGGYEEGVGTIRAAGGDLGGCSETKVSLRRNMVVRRLTPKECCRLMAWEDDRLDVREGLELDGNLWKPTGKQVEQADGPKYKQAGNGVASNCSEWIARRMRHVLEG